MQLSILDYKNLLFRGMKFHCISHLTKYIIRILLILVSIPALAQNGNLLNNKSLNNSGNTNSSPINDQQTGYLKRLYSERVEAPKELINGKEYEPYYTRSKIKPLLFPEKERTSSIITNTRRYNNLTLQYDTFLDEVVYTDTSRTINFRFPQIALNKNIINGFNLYFKDDSLIFRYYRLPECSAKNLKEGFYEIAYEGKSQYIIKHESSFYVREGLNNYKYSPKNLISTGDGFYKIKTKKSLLRLFGERSGKVKEYLHSSGVKVRKADKGQFISVLKFYDSLLKSE
jgi:hypothetical protein